MITSGICPECGRAVGTAHGVSPLKHMVNCLHVDFAPPTRLRGTHAALADGGNVRSQRIIALVDMEEANVEEGG